MFPNSHFADTLCDGNVFITASVGEAEVEYALFLIGEMACHELVNVRQPRIFAVCIRNLFRLRHFLHVQFHTLMAQSFETLFSDARQQVALRCAWHQDRLPMKQVLEDVADHILALLLIVEDGARHPIHFGIMLFEQLLDQILFHHVFYCNTLQTHKTLTPKYIFFKKT